MPARGSPNCLWRSSEAAIYARHDVLSISFGRDRVYTFDLSGRLLTLFRAGDFYQRSLGNSFLHKGRRSDLQSHTQALVRFRERLSPKQAEVLLADVWAELSDLHTALPAGRAQQVMEQLLNWGPEQLAEHGRRFEQIYRPISILPPDQYLSLVLQISEGCSYNRCAFCNFYKGRPFKTKSAEEFRQHVQAVSEFLGPAAAHRKGIFLADGDALMTPQTRLLECLDVLREVYPNLPLYSFMDAFRPQAKSLADFRQLATAGLRRVYLGIETGDSELLSWLNKPGSPEQMWHEADKIRQAGLGLGLIFMVGAGGQTYAERHRQASLAWLQRFAPGTDDLIFLSEFIPHPDQPYAAAASEAGVTPLSPAELAAELRLWRQGLADLKAKVVPYHLQEFIY